MRVSVDGTGRVLVLSPDAIADPEAHPDAATFDLTPGEDAAVVAAREAAGRALAAVAAAEGALVERRAAIMADFGARDAEAQKEGGEVAYDPQRGFHARPKAAPPAPSPQEAHADRLALLAARAAADPAMAALLAELGIVKG